MVDSALLSKKLVAGLDSLGLVLPGPACSSLVRFCDLLIKWNRTFNLTSVSDPEQIIIVHLLDSLAVVPYLPGGTVIDVGTGAGLPGIPLAIARPEQSFVLLDSNGKKTRFLNQVIGDLRLTNVNIVHSRVEQYETEEKFSTVISRAFTSVEQFLLSCSHLVSADGQFIAMKGKYPADELRAMPAGFELVSSHRLEIPGLNAERHLLILRRS